MPVFYTIEEPHPAQESFSSPCWPSLASIVLNPKFILFIQWHRLVVEKLLDLWSSQLKFFECSGYSLFSKAIFAHLSQPIITVSSLFGAILSYFGNLGPSFCFPFSASLFLSLFLRYCSPDTSRVGLFYPAVIGLHLTILLLVTVHFTWSWVVQEFINVIFAWLEAFALNQELVEFFSYWRMELM